jgi:hypothetical protein
LRGQKNRFGAVNEVGIFAMTDNGLREVKNPSAIFLDRADRPAPGTTVMVVWEGTRPLLVEIQALVDDSSLGNPRRVAVGFEQNRLAMLLAVLHRHAGIQVGDQDVFANVVGGVRVLETSADLALLVAVVSSLRNRVLSKTWLSSGRWGCQEKSAPYPVVRSASVRLPSTVSNAPWCPEVTRPSRRPRAFRSSRYPGLKRPWRRRSIQSRGNPTTLRSTVFLVRSRLRRLPRDQDLSLDNFMDGLKRRNPNEAEFHQAVAEVAHDIIPFVLERPEYQQAGIIRRITEPDRIIIFRVVWEDDNGQIRVNRGYRVQFN